MKYLVLSRRYRPQSFHEVFGQGSILATLKNALQYQRAAHAYLFCGPRGVGKTTLARIFAKALNCESPTVDFEPCNQCLSCIEIGGGYSLDVIEIDGASNRGIDDIRSLNETIAYAPSRGKYKIYILDEVHMLTKEAFNALLKTLEEPPESVKFFFATTEPHKVLPTILSRCQRFDLHPLTSEQIAKKLLVIGKDLKREVPLEVAQLIASCADGSLRDAESLLDQVLCFCQGDLSMDSARQILGLFSSELFAQLDLAFQTNSVSFAFELAEQIAQMGRDPLLFAEQLISHYRQICLVHSLQKHPIYSQEEAFHIFNLAIEGYSIIQKSPFPRASLESLLLKILKSKSELPLDVLVEKLIELEKRLSQLPPSGTKEELSHTAPSSVAAEPRLLAVPFRLDPSPKKLPPPEPQREPPQIKAPLEPQESKPVSCPEQPIHPSQYETLLRFAAVELEGTIKLT